MPEFIKDEIGLVPMSVTTFYSPLTEIKDDTENGSRSPTPKVSIKGWEDEDWINLIQCYVEDKNVCIAR